MNRKKMERYVREQGWNCEKGKKTAQTKCTSPEGVIIIIPGQSNPYTSKEAQCKLAKQLKISKEELKKLL